MTCILIDEWRKIVRYIACLLLLLTSTECCFAEPTTEDAASLARKMLDDAREWKPGALLRVVNTAKQAVVLVRYRGATGDWSEGTGFVISPDGLIMTCAHVIEGSTTPPKAGTTIRERIWVRTATGTSLEAIKVYADALNDIAVLQVKAPCLSSLLIGFLPAVQGQEVIVLGYPGGHALGSEVTLTKGIVSAVRSADRVLQIDAAVNQGCSGGPVLNSDGRVVGMAWAKLTGLENANFAVSCTILPGPSEIAIAACGLPLGDGLDIRRLANSRAWNGGTPLMYAAQHDLLGAAKTLLSRGADPNATERVFGYSALHWAESPQMVALLLQSGAAVDGIDATNETPLFKTCRDRARDEIARQLIAAGASVDQRNIFGVSILHEAVRFGNTPILKAVVDSGADVNAVDAHGCTPLHWAVAKDERGLAVILTANGGQDKGSLSWNAIDTLYVSAINEHLGKRFDAMK